MSAQIVPQVLVVGCGAVVQELHGGALSQLEKQGVLKVVALADPADKRIQEFQKRFPAAKGYPDAAAALAGQHIDITLVASPPSLHRQHTEVALQAGSHVLCEKPFTVTAADAAFLTRLAETKQRLVAVGLTRRFFPSLAMAAQLVADGSLGDNLTFICREGGAFNWPLTSDALFRRATAGGGVLADKGVHVLDSLLWVFGRMNVASAQDDAQTGGVEGNITLQLAGTSLSGTLQLSFTQALNSGFWISGSRGEVWVQPEEFRFIRRRQGPGPWERVPCTAGWPLDAATPNAPRVIPKNYDECIIMQWVAMVRAVRFGEAVPVTAAQAEFVISQIEEAYRVVKPWPQPWLSPAEQAVATAKHWKNS